jgi:hypothetical protein
MRIDASGNLLVGTTDLAVSSSTGSVTGTVINNSGLFEAAKTGTVMELNRLTADGTILNFRKDGTTVGSISASTNLNIGSGGTRIWFRDGTKALRPVSTEVGNGSDGIINIGEVEGRFKDLYLSGGVYLGGTGAANLLEDYETGTFTPVLADAITGGNTATGSTVEGHYTKVGRLVTLNMSLININTTGMTGGLDLFIRALPFTSAGGQTGRGEGSVRADKLTYSGYVTPAIEIADAYLRLADNVSATSDAWLDVSAINSGNTDLFISISYNVA